MCSERYVRVHVVSRKFYKTQCYFSMRCRNSKNIRGSSNRTYPQDADNEMTMGAMYPAPLVIVGRNGRRRYPTLRDSRILRGAEEDRDSISQDNNLKERPVT